MLRRQLDDVTEEASRLADEVDELTKQLNEAKAKVTTNKVRIICLTPCVHMLIALSWAQGARAWSFKPVRKTMQARATSCMPCRVCLCVCVCVYERIQDEKLSARVKELETKLLEAQAELTLAKKQATEAEQSYQALLNVAARNNVLQAVNSEVRGRMFVIPAALSAFHSLPSQYVTSMACSVPSSTVA